MRRRRTRIPGVHGGGRLGPPETDGRYFVADSVNGPYPDPRFCREHVYWPMPCRRCREAGELAKVKP